MDSHAIGSAAATGSAPQEHGTAADLRRPSVAVIGAGVSGLTAAYLLSRTHDVTLFEAEDRLGGHAHTHHVTDSDGRQHAVDSGFIVHNDVTYPWLRKLFGELDVQVREALPSHQDRTRPTIPAGSASNPPVPLTELDTLGMSELQPLGPKRRRILGSRSGMPREPSEP